LGYIHERLIFCEIILRLREKRVEYKKKLKKSGLADIPTKERWSIEDEHLLEQTADATRRGFIFASIKNPIL
jgi:hypothetical protein